MPRLFSSRQIIKVLEKKGFIFISQKGSHSKYRTKSKPKLTVIVPIKRREIPYGTFRCILRQANITEKEFKK